MPTNRSRRAGLLLCALLAPLTSACDEKAQEFARRTAEILQLRSGALAKKIDAESKAYKDVAAVAARTQRDLIDSSLGNERSARSIALAADYDEGRKSPSRWQTDLGEYAQIDYRLTRDLLAADVDAGSEFQQKLQALEIEQARIDAVAKLLAALAKKPTLAEDLEAVGAFAEDTKKEFDKQVCGALAKDQSDAAKAAFKAKGCES